MNKYRNLLKLHEIGKENNRRGMWIGPANEDPYLLFHWIHGFMMALTKKESIKMEIFIENLYEKYGRDGSFGWYKSLQNFSNGNGKAVEIFFKEYCNFFESNLS